MSISFVEEHVKYRAHNYMLWKQGLFVFLLFLVDGFNITNEQFLGFFKINFVLNLVFSSIQYGKKKLRAMYLPYNSMTDTKIMVDY